MGRSPTPEFRNSELIQLMGSLQSPPSGCRPCTLRPLSVLARLPLHATANTAGDILYDSVIYLYILWSTQYYSFSKWCTT